MINIPLEETLISVCLRVTICLFFVYARTGTWKETVLKSSSKLHCNDCSIIDLRAASTLWGSFRLGFILNFLQRTRMATRNEFYRARSPSKSMQKEIKFTTNESLRWRFCCQSSDWTKGSSPSHRHRWRWSVSTYSSLQPSHDQVTCLAVTLRVTTPSQALSPDPLKTGANISHAFRMLNALKNEIKYQKACKVISSPSQDVRAKPSSFPSMHFGAAQGCVSSIIVSH